VLDINEKSAKHHILSIRLASGGFSFFILNVLDNRVVLFEHSPIKSHQDIFIAVLNRFRKDELFSFGYKEVKVFIDTPELTTVPEGLYHEDKKNDIFDLNIERKRGSEVLVNHSPHYNVNVLFSLQKEFISFMEKNFSNVTFSHSLLALLAHSIDCKNKSKEQLFINYNSTHLTIIAVRNSGLVYHNAFTLLSEDDFTYFLLLVFQELNFDQDSAELFIAGEVDSDDLRIQTLRGYIKNITFSSLPEGYLFPDEVTEKGAHYYSNFFYQLL
jgi:hypothetical protein